MAKKQRSTDGQMENGLIMLFGSACLALVQYIFLAAIIISTNHAAAKSITDKQHMCEAFFNSFMYHQPDLYTLTTHLIFKFHLHPHVRLEDWSGLRGGAAERRLRGRLRREGDSAAASAAGRLRGRPPPRPGAARARQSQPVPSSLSR
jgi:hypothetical protein